MNNRINREKCDLRKSGYVSDIIDVYRLERENRKFLFAGYIVAILLFFALEPLIPFRKHILSTSEKTPISRIRVDLVTVPRTPEEQETPAESQLTADIDKIVVTEENVVPHSETKTETQSQSAADSLKIAHPDADSKKVASILLQPPPVKKFPAIEGKKNDLLASGIDSTKIDYLTIPFLSSKSGDTPSDITDLHADIPITENLTTILGPGYGIVYWDPFPDEEEEEDERRQFKYDLLGVPIGGKGLAFGVGPGSVYLDVGGVVNSGRHFLKSVVWKIEDMVKEGRIQTMRDNGFSRITEKDIRFMVLLWKYDRVDPRRISRNDRLYIAKAQTRDIMPHFKYLDTMEKRGLASSLKKKGRLVYKANFTREEIMHTFIYAYNAIKDPGTKDVVSGYINLIAE